MVKVRLLVNRAGLDFSQSIGDEIEVDGAEAEAMIAAGQAEAIGRVAKRRGRGKGREKATREQRETADLPPAEERDATPVEDFEGVFEEQGGDSAR